MNIPACVIEDFKEYKNSYNQVGSIYNDNVYPADRYNSKRRSSLKKLVLGEEEQKGKKYLAKYKTATGFVREGKEVMAAKKWKGRLSESQDWKRYNYLTCGKYGMLEENATGDKRPLVYKCNQRKMCPACREDYHKEKARKAEDLAAVVMRANGVRHLRKFRLTFPDFISDQIVANNHQTIFKNLANDFLQELYGCSKDKHGIYLRGSVGVGIQCHRRSTQECWKDFFHLHGYVIPLRVDCDEVENVDSYVGKADVASIKTRWFEKVQQCCLNLGYEGADKIIDNLDVNVSYKRLPKRVKKGKRPGFDLTYDMRSPAHDLEKAAAAVSMEDQKIIMSFKRGGLGYFENWSFEDYADQLVMLLAYKNLNSAYGWLRRGEHYAAALGVEVEKEKDDFTPVPALSVRVQYERDYKAETVPGKKKIKIVKHLYMRSLKDANNPGAWIEIDLWKVHEEVNFIESRKKRTYSVAKGKSPP
ncbi:hypothetical protein ES703_69858 [subsurface metagenome]